MLSIEYGTISYHSILAQHATLKLGVQFYQLHKEDSGQNSYYAEYRIVS